LALTHPDAERADGRPERRIALGQTPMPVITVPSIRPKQK
jgi:hypothetical protein